MRSLTLLLSLLIALAAAQAGRGAYQDLQPSLIPSAPVLTFTEMSAVTEFPPEIELAPVGVASLAEVSSTVSGDVVKENPDEALIRIRKTIADKAHNEEEEEETRIERIVQQRLADIQMASSRPMMPSLPVSLASVAEGTISDEELASLAETGASNTRTSTGATNTRTSTYTVVSRSLPESTPAPAIDPMLTPQEAEKQRALGAAKAQLEAEILAKVRQVDGETKWIDQVKEILVQYQGKADQVDINIHSLRLDVVDLLKKKKQVENLQIQNDLAGKMQQAREDMATLAKAATTSSGKTQDMSEIKSRLEASIAEIETQLAELKDGGSSPVAFATSSVDPATTVSDALAASAAPSDAAAADAAAADAAAGDAADAGSAGAFFLEAGAKDGAFTDLSMPSMPDLTTYPPGINDAISDLIERAEHNMDRDLA